MSHLGSAHLKAGTGAGGGAPCPKRPCSLLGGRRLSSFQGEPPPGAPHSLGWPVAPPKGELQGLNCVFPPDWRQKAGLPPPSFPPPFPDETKHLNYHP